MGKSRAAYLIVAVCAFALVGVRPAAAHTEFCAGQARMTFGSFTLVASDTSKCLPSMGGLSANLSLTGNCLMATGSGTANGHFIKVSWAMGHMEWTATPTTDGSWVVGSWTSLDPTACAVQTEWAMAGWAAMVL